jgi:3-deoxy-manno-octulosonate cytidylyltransferase (CMP-KDO synthetase)
MAYAGLEADIIVNIQGDEPGIISQQIDELVAPFKDESVDISTLCIAFDKRDNISNPNKVKVVIGVNRNAMMFSRLPIPYNINNKIQVKYFKHIGLYAYRAKVLKKLIKLQETPLEKAESLEQLRWLENGYSIYIKETMIESQSVDTPEDLKSFIKSL